MSLASFLNLLPFLLGAALLFGIAVGMAVRRKFTPGTAIMAVGVFFAPFDFQPSVRLFTYAADSARIHPLPPELQGDEKYLALTALIWFFGTLFGIWTAFVSVWKRR